MVSIINAFLFFQGIYFQLPREKKKDVKSNLTLSLPQTSGQLLGDHTEACHEGHGLIDACNKL